MDHPKVGGSTRVDHLFGDGLGRQEDCEKRAPFRRKLDHPLGDLVHHSDLAPPKRGVAMSWSPAALGKWNMELGFGASGEICKAYVLNDASPQGLAPIYDRCTYSNIVVYIYVHISIYLYHSIPMYLWSSIDIRRAIYLSVYLSMHAPIYLYMHNYA